MIQPVLPVFSDFKGGVDFLPDFIGLVLFKKLYLVIPTSYGDKFRVEKLIQEL